MPSSTDVKKAFHLGNGETIASRFVIEGCVVGHEVKEQNERYEFPTTVKLGSASEDGEEVPAKEALQAFKAHVKESRLVHSAYGSPYSCTFGPAKLSKATSEGGTVTITALGKAVRRRDLPTLREVKEKEREEQGQAQDISADDEGLLSGMRVIRSRFGTSKCSICMGTIDPGLRIARPEGAQGRGGWAHVGCVVGQKKKEAHGSAGPATPKKTQRKPAAKAKAGVRDGAGEAGGANEAGGKRKRGQQKVAQQVMQAHRKRRGRR